MNEHYLEIHTHKLIHNQQHSHYVHMHLHPPPPFIVYNIILTTQNIAHTDTIKFIITYLKQVSDRTVGQACF